MRMYDIIRKKRDNEKLTKEEIDFFIDGLISGDIPDFQASALLMAIYYNNLDIDELSFLTDKMAHSGDMADLSGINGVTVDKHSTGGVGDKTTLIVAPIVAALGGKIAKLSGGGLGHTGGTKDKLKSIEGFRTELSSEEMIAQINKIGVCLASQSGNLAPADKKLYALRNDTATVENAALIASSIMSKKIASGAENIVLDVKTGSGAFMKTVDDSRILAKLMVDIGEKVGRNVCAVITNMDIPLGRAVGNSLEVIEAVDFLKGRCEPDLKEVCVELAVHMLMPVNGKNENECRKLVIEAIENGTALAKLKEIVKFQGGNPQWIDDTNLFGKAEYIIDIKSEKSGYVSHMNAEKIGTVAMHLGVGREKVSDGINYRAGIILHKKVGDYVNSGDVLAQFHTDKPELAEYCKDIFISALNYSDSEVEKPQLIYDVISK